MVAATHVGVEETELDSLAPNNAGNDAVSDADGVDEI